MDRSSGRRATVAKGGDGHDAQMRTHACGQFRRTRGREPTRDGLSTVTIGLCVPSKPGGGGAHWALPLRTSGGVAWEWGWLLLRFAFAFPLPATLLCTDCISQLISGL
eukprot:5240482-Prymnesium_polylepis.1